MCCIFSEPYLLSLQIALAFRVIALVLHFSRGADPERSGGSKNLPDGVPTVTVPWAGGSTGRLIPHEGLGIINDLYNGCQA